MILVALAFLSAVTGAASDAAAGQAVFERQWVAAPSAPRKAEGQGSEGQGSEGQGNEGQANQGLGPLYDSPSCNACHVGAGPGPVSDGIGAGLLVRLGNATGAGDPVYGAQLQTRALPGLAPEATVRLVWGLHDGRRSGALHISDPGYGAFDPGTYAAVRRAPSLRGAGLLEAVSDGEILALAAREHRAGLSGHAALLADAHGARLGRWGWKAASADLPSQIAVAFANDIGLSTAQRPAPWGDCTPAETACRALAAPSPAVGGESARIEVPDALRAALVAYIAALPAPSAPNDHSPGAAIFRRAGCDTCHAALATPDGRRVDAMTDLLLHDMGPELDDGIAEGAAKPSEWRTAPLWNVAAELAAGGLLHDGRARSIAEAVGWHGGAASVSRHRFRALAPAERAALENYLIGR